MPANEEFWTQFTAAYQRGQRVGHEQARRELRHFDERAADAEAERLQELHYERYNAEHDEP